MRSFLFSLVSFFILASCSTYQDGFTSVKKNKEIYTPKFLTQKNIEQVFKIDIEVYGHLFGGILVIKKIEPQQYRIALITEIGAKLLDFELKNGEMKVNYAIKQLNRKMILTILKQDFLILLNENATVQSQYTFQEDNIYQTVLNGKKLYYFVKSDSGQLEKTVLVSKRKEKTVVTYDYLDEKFPNMQINHKNKDLKILMRLLENE